MAFKSLRARTTALFAASIGGLLLITVTTIIVTAKRDAENQAETLLSAASSKIAFELTGPTPFGPAQLAEEERDLAVDHLLLAVFAPDGKVIHQSGRDIPPQVSGRGWRVKTLSMGANRMVIGLPFRKIDDALRREAITLTGLALIVFLATTAGAWLLVGRTLAPIRGLIEQVKHAGTLDPKVKLSAPSTDSEMVDLVGTLNDLLNRLAESGAARSRFYAAASHELRTPLQALSGHLELGLSRHRTEDEYRETLKEAFSQTQRLTSLVRDILLLHRLEGTSNQHAESVDLSESYQKAIALLMTQATERGLTLDVASLESVTFRASLSHVDVLMRNLIENAVLNAKRGSTISVRTSQTGECIICEVENEIAEPTQSVMETPFEPFFNRDESRSSEGNGLGLAICKAIADSNGWVLTLVFEGNRARAKLVIAGPSLGCGI